MTDPSEKKYIFVDPALYQFATTRQAEYLDAIEACGGSQKDAADMCNVKKQTVNVAYMAVQRKASQRGWVPENDRRGVHKSFAIPDGYKLKGRSTYIGRDGEPRGEWIKTDIDRERQLEIMQETINGLTSDIVPLEPLPVPSTETLSDLLNIYTFTDTHIGMLAWGRETGKDWDLDIAEKTVVSCFADMIRRSAPAETAVIAQLGDWMHYDSLEAVTPTSGHVLDADSRAGKMVSVAARTLRSLVDMALAHHQTVHLLVAEGNHDLFGSLMLRTAFRMMYENEPRVKLIESENPYYAMRFGKNMFAWHHGHKKGLDATTALFVASLYPEMFGETEYRTMFFGDKHHKQVKELAGFTLEQLGTLAANDAYAIRGGWKSHQYAESITFHRELGEAGRVRSTPAMVGL